MSDAAREYTRERLNELIKVQGLAEEDRLYRNMMSSQPIAFSIVGELRDKSEAAAAVFAELTGEPVVGLATLHHETHRLDRFEAEWFPPRERHTRDHSGFDMAAYLALEGGERLLLTVEVKYIDKFSPDRLKCDDPRYEEHLKAAGLSREATNAIVADGGTQFLRSVLLTDSVRRRGVNGDATQETSGVDKTLAVVLAREDDRTASKVVGSIKQHDLPTAVDLWSHRTFLNLVAEQPPLRNWAERMQRRYLP